MCWHQWWPLPALLVWSSFRFALTTPPRLFISLHICAARLLPLRLWPAWRLRITEQARPKPLHLPHHQGPSCRASTQCTSRTATISTYFRPSNCDSFPASFHWLSTSPKRFPKRFITALLEHALHTRRLSFRSTAPLAFYSLYPCLQSTVVERERERLKRCVRQP